MKQARVKSSYEKLPHIKKLMHENNFGIQMFGTKTNILIALRRKKQHSSLIP